jgi:hypothetical protein
MRSDEPGLVLVQGSYADGFQAAKFAQAVQEYCADPASFEPPTG